jgi:protein AaeX
LTGEFNFFGVFVPELLVYALLALLVQIVMGRVLNRLDAHRFVWHPALVEIATFIIWLGGITAAAHWIQS